jgi:RNA polymerase sigma factor (sigma-70 family)
VNIVTAIKEGNEKAFSDVYNTSKDKLYFWLLKKTSSSYLAQELLQQTFCKLWLSRSSLNEELSVDVQLFRIARSLMIDELRRQIRLKENLSLLPHLEESDDTTWQTYAVRELTAKLDVSLQQMSPVSRDVFLLSRKHGLTYQQISEKLSISVKTVEYHISKVLSELRKTLLLLSILFINY